MNDYRKGIDVSEHNGVIDWAKVRAAGIDFAIIRSGYGVSHKDTRFDDNIAGALANGIGVGIYHFSYALSEAGAEAEADFCASILAPWHSRIHLPVFFDLEYDSVDYAARQGVTIDRDAFNRFANTFLDRILQRGYDPGIYFNLDYLARYCDLDALDPCEQWLASWNAGTDWSGYDLWQAGQETVDGISGPVDVNYTSDAWYRYFMYVAEPMDDLLAGPTETEKEELTMKIWTNGSTREPVYADTARRTRVGSLNPWESCDCLGMVEDMYLVRYEVDGTAAQKVGLVDYAGGTVWQ